MWLWFSLSLALTLTACSTVTRVGEAKASHQLPFLQVGRVTRSEVIQRLGKPSHSYEGGRIVSYQLKESDGHLQVDAAAQYCLMLVYAENDQLVRRSLIRLR
jgi:hypothetical protein